MKVFLSILFSVLICTSAHASPFVAVRDGKFVRNGQAYIFMGTNFWYGANLGSPGPGGDRARLVRELDRLQAMGVSNLRILAASEGPANEPWRIVPALQNAPGEINEQILEGLDFLLVEMRKREMTAVVCLTNFWPWSGGMAQYLKWFGEGAIPYPPPQPGGRWDTYQAYTAKFYSNAQAMQAYRNVIKLVIERKNKISGQLYRDDPTIMAWQLANEPRGYNNKANFQRWIDQTAEYIKSLDSKHLVTTGSEGETPWPFNSGLDFIKNHQSRNIDYSTAHIWVQNWGMYDPFNASGTLPRALDYMRRYVQDHITKTQALNKPVVLEEFGISRDLNSHDPASSVVVRDNYYRQVFEQVYQAAKAGKPIAGVNFWAWGGEGRPLQPYGGHWREGHPFIGDPAHESQGWYSVYDRDESTIKIITEYAAKLKAVGAKAPTAFVRIK